MSLTVGFDATAAVRQAAGIGRYTRQLMQALARRDDAIAYRAFYCSAGELRGSLPPLSPAWRTRSVPLSDRVLNAIWHRSRLPLPVQIFTGRFDLFHSPDFTLPPTLGRPTVVTIHDLAFLRVPECAYPTLRDYLARVVPRAIRAADRVVAVSARTRDDILELVGIEAAKVSVVYHGVDSRFGPAGDPAQVANRVSTLGIERPYILSVGTLEPRKNYPRLLEAFVRLRASGLGHQLVIAGAPGWLYSPVFDTIARLKLQDAVRIVQPADEALTWLYQGADLFVYPSLYEGFGLPALEALACGAVVACSGSSSLPEVVRDAAVLFEPTDVESMSDAMARCLTDDTLRACLRARSVTQAAQFTWEGAADQTVSLYRTVYAGA